jgi:hypothetical protein
MKSYVIDRFEGDFAVLEAPEGGTVDVQRAKMPAGAKEGDALKYDEASGIYSPDEEATRLRGEKIKELMDELFGR